MIAHRNYGGLERVGAALVGVRQPVATKTISYWREGTAIGGTRPASVHWRLCDGLADLPLEKGVRRAVELLVEYSHMSAEDARVRLRRKGFRV